MPETMKVTIAPANINHNINQHYPNVAQMGAAALQALQHALPAPHINAVVVEIKLMNTNNPLLGVAGVNFTINSNTHVDPVLAKAALA